MKKVVSVLVVLVLLAGLAFILYPTVANLWNTMHHSQMVSHFLNNVSTLKQEEYDRIISDARNYNDKMAKTGIRKYVLSEDELNKYEGLLNINGDGMMGYLDIPSINVKIPVYHGSDEAVLQFAAGHIEWSSLPVGGKGSHTVISGHRGVPSAKLLSNIDQLKIGEYFILHILNETYTYQVDDIKIVLPKEIEQIQIDPQMDYTTLVTCTPYGINTHRLLVRGHRVSNLTDEEYSQEKEKNNSYLFIVFAVAIITVVIVLCVILLIRRKKKRGEKYVKNQNE